MPLAGNCSYFLFFFKKNVAFNENYLSLHPLQLGGIAQLVEHLLCKQRVAGSNPTTSTSKSTARRQSGGFFVSARKGARSFPYRCKKSIRAKPGRSILFKCPRGERLSEMAGRRPGKSDYLPQTRLIISLLQDLRRTLRIIP